MLRIVCSKLGKTYKLQITFQDHDDNCSFYSCSEYIRAENRTQLLNGKTLTTTLPCFIQLSKLLLFVTFVESAPNYLFDAGFPFEPPVHGDSITELLNTCIRDFYHPNVKWSVKEYYKPSELSTKLYPQWSKTPKFVKTVDLGAFGINVDTFVNHQNMATLFKECLAKDKTFGGKPVDTSFTTIDNIFVSTGSPL